MNILIYHHPRCSKSRKTLELIHEAGIDPQIVEYLKEPPDAATILQLATLLGLPVVELVRNGGDDVTDETLSLEDGQLARWLATHPAALQRPIVVDMANRRACLGRPPENVLALLRA